MQRPAHADPDVLCAVGGSRAGPFRGEIRPGTGLAGEWATRYACGVTEGSRRASDGGHALRHPHPPSLSRACQEGK